MTLFRFLTPRGGTLLSAAVYRGPQGRRLFIWYGRRVLSLALASLAATVLVLAGAGAILAAWALFEAIGWMP